MADIKETHTTFRGAMYLLYKSIKHSIKSKIIKLSKLGGSLSAFTISLGLVLIWAISGPYFKYSDTWQLVINTGTTIITFLMAFSIQFSQNRDTKEIKLILRSLMKQNEDLRDQLAAIEQELDEDDQ